MRIIDINYLPRLIIYADWLSSITGRGPQDVAEVAVSSSYQHSPDFQNAVAVSSGYNTHQPPQFCN
jgi:hypothetical protein